MTVAKIKTSAGWVWMAGIPAPANAYAQNVGDGVTTTFTITHGLNANDVMVQVRETASTQKIIYPEIRKLDNNSISVIFSPAPTANQYRVLVTGNEFVTSVGTGAAGGDLSGSYPNPQIAAGAVGTPELTAAVLALLPQPGDIKWVAFDVTPANEGTLCPGWLVADGRTTLLTATYPALSALCKPIYGGDATHFTLPPMAGRTVIAKGAGAGLTVRTIGATGGEERHTLANSEQASHQHGPGSFSTNSVSAGTPSGSVGGVGDHSHGMSQNIIPSRQGLQVGNIVEVVGAAGSYTTGVAMSGAGGHGHSWAGDPLGLHGHSVTAGVSDFSGGGASHENMQPWIALTPLIKT